MWRQQFVLALTLVACVLKSTLCCSCTGTFEQRILNADFAAIAKVTSDEVPTPKGNYYEIEKTCVIKTPYGTDAERAYMTTREREPGLRTSCDGPYLQKDKEYLIIGMLHDTGNSDTDSVSYHGCSGFTSEWRTMNPAIKATIKDLLQFGDCP